MHCCDPAGLTPEAGPPGHGDWGLVDLGQSNWEKQKINDIRDR